MYSPINAYLKKHKKIEYLLNGEYQHRALAPQIECKDGFRMSVQASDGHYCKPRENDCDFYSSVEVGFPSALEDLLMPFAEDPSNPTETVYGWVPEQIVNAVIEKHGGIK